MIEDYSWPASSHVAAVERAREAAKYPKRHERSKQAGDDSNGTTADQQSSSIPPQITDWASI